MPKTVTQTVDAVDVLKQHPALEPTTAGRRIHQAVATLLERDVRQPTALQVMELARDIVCTEELAPSRRQSAIQRLATSTASYFRLFAPTEEWSFIGAEVAGRNCRFDFAFKSNSGRVIVDELKTGRFVDKVQRQLADAQIETAVKAGVIKWSDGFDGVRVLFLSAPRASFVARPDGSREVLGWGERG